MLWGGNQINYTGEVGTPTAEMFLVKILFNSVVSTPGARFMAINISDFYLGTPLKRKEYFKLSLRDIPDKIIAEYRVHDMAVDDHIYVKDCKGM